MRDSPEQAVSNRTTSNCPAKTFGRISVCLGGKSTLIYSAFGHLKRINYSSLEVCAIVRT